MGGQTQTEPPVKSYDFEKLSLQHTCTTTHHYTPLYTEEKDPIFSTIWIYSLDYITMWSTEIAIFTKLKLLIQPRSQGLSSLPPLVVGIKTLVLAGHVTTCDTNFSTGVESMKNFCRSQLKRNKVDHWPSTHRQTHL